MAQRIETIDAIRGQRLRACGCETVEKLLQLGATRPGRRRLAASSGLDEKQILEAVTIADLLRIKGIGVQFAELLHAVGVDTVKELRRRNADALVQKMIASNESAGLVRKAPSRATVEKWISQAGELPPVVEY